MDLKKKAEELSCLADLMRKTGLTRLEYAEGDFQVKMEMEPPVQGAATVTDSLSIASPADNADKLKDADASLAICSPLVGTVYLAPGPGQENYVCTGDTVAAGDVVCIIESMKLLNEIKAEKSGVITEVCVRSEEVVECNQPLFLMREIPEV